MEKYALLDIMLDVNVEVESVTSLLAQEIKSYSEQISVFEKEESEAKKNISAADKDFSEKVAGLPESIKIAALLKEVAELRKILSKKEVELKSSTNHLIDGLTDIRSKKNDLHTAHSERIKEIKNKLPSGLVN